MCGYVPAIYLVRLAEAERTLQPGAPLRQDQPANLTRGKDKDGPNKQSAYVAIDEGLEHQRKRIDGLWPKPKPANR